MSATRVYGIDLGTTYSCIGYVDEYGKPVIVSNSEGLPTTPSVVYFESPDNIVVGRTAKDVAELHPTQVVSTVKRVMGDPEWLFEHEGRQYHPQDISSFILRKLVEDAKIVTGDTITDVVITCPAYFGVNQKEATRQAGTLAGLNVRYVIPEPTAAAIAYGVEQTDPQTLLVYDLGGGTFDVTVIEVKPEAITVICTGGDHMLGGKNWDETIANWFAQEFSVQTGTPAESLLDDLETWQELLNLAESAKIGLSARETFPAKIRHGAHRAVIELTRAKFDELTSGLLTRTISMTQEMLETARAKGCEKIDKLLLVGGSTYMPQVVEAVRQHFPYEIRQFDPNQAVAKGAAIFGFKCYLDESIKIKIAEEMGTNPESVKVEDIDESTRKRAQKEVALENGLSLAGVIAMAEQKIYNVSSKSFGIVAFDQDDKERVFNLVVANDQVPAKYTSQFHTKAENQTSVSLRCMENMSTSRDAQPLEDSTMLGEAELLFSRPLPKASPIEVTFALTPDGLLSLNALDLTTKGTLETSFVTDAVLSVAQIEEKRERNLAINVS